MNTLTIAFGLLWALAYLMDWGQTIQITRSDAHYELNPFLGRRPSEANVHYYFAVILVAIAIATYVLSPLYRMTLFAIGFGAQGATAYWNHREGLDWRFWRHLP